MVSWASLLKLGPADFTELRSSGFREGGKKAIQLKLKGSNLIPTCMNPTMLQIEGQVQQGLPGRWKLQFLCWGCPVGTGSAGAVWSCRGCCLGWLGVFLAAREGGQVFTAEPGHPGGCSGMSCFDGNDVQCSLVSMCSGSPASDCHSLQKRNLICQVLEMVNTNNVRIIHTTVDVVSRQLPTASSHRRIPLDLENTENGRWKWIDYMIICKNCINRESCAPEAVLPVDVCPGCP